MKAMNLAAVEAVMACSKPEYLKQSNKVASKHVLKQQILIALPRFYIYVLTQYIFSLIWEDQKAQSKLAHNNNSTIPLTAR